jgi:hypothetical protein
MKPVLKISTILLFTILPLFIGTYFSIDLPLEVLLGKLAKNLPLSLVGGILTYLFQEWALKHLPKESKP